LTAISLYFMAYGNVSVRITSCNTVNDMQENLAAGDTIIKYIKQTIPMNEIWVL